MCYVSRFYNHGMQCTFGRMSNKASVLPLQVVNQSVASQSALLRPLPSADNAMGAVKAIPEHLQAAL